MQSPVSGNLERLSTGDESDYDVGGVLVEVLAATVVDGCRSGISVAGSELNFAERDSCVAGRHGERGSEHVRMDQADPGSLSNRAHPAVSGAAIEALSIVTQQNRARLVSAL
jgi:hypothetical protein